VVVVLVVLVVLVEVALLLVVVVLAVLLLLLVLLVTVAFIESHFRTACVKSTASGFKIYELKTVLRKV
jgi:hypothetical protein